MRYLPVIILVLMLAGCGGQPAMTPTPTFAPTPTLLPTVVPGSGEDERDVANIIEQFGQAVVRGDTLVALLVLTPSAQRVVAAGDIETFLGRRERPRALEVERVRLTEDIATADCAVRYAAGDVSIQLRLVRLDGQWKIDARVNQ